MDEEQRNQHKFSARNCFSAKPAKPPCKLSSGAVLLDQDFEAMIAQRLYDAWDVPESIKTEMMNSLWERGMKKSIRRLGSNVEDYHSISLRGACAPPAIYLEKAHVKDMFENIVSRSRRLVDSQFAAVESKENELPKGMVLVGGFASCRYIHKVLDRENRHRHIEMLQSSGAKP
ncbi:hypothetical protein BKA63DRAFT_601063 [Paraphoma chrysanthemicola]|nr:hypothetical protein BKA63DRAFT_601063 [Paraphoma chrysanthemicola]